MMSPHSRGVSSTRYRGAISSRGTLRSSGARALDVRLARAPVRDEVVFVVAHQTHELWLNQLLCELAVLVTDLDADRLSAAGRTLERATRIATLLLEQTRGLAALPLRERSNLDILLGGALERDVLRQLERLAGSGATSIERWIARERRPDRPRSTSVREAFIRAVWREPSEHERPPSSSPTVAALQPWLASRLALPECSAQRELSDGLRLLDEQLGAWLRLRDGLRPRRAGSGRGTRPAALGRHGPFFPELWPEGADAST